MLIIIGAGPQIIRTRSLAISTIAKVPSTWARWSRTTSRRIRTLSSSNPMAPVTITARATEASSEPLACIVHAAT